MIPRCSRNEFHVIDVQHRCVFCIEKWITTSQAKTGRRAGDILGSSRVYAHQQQALQGALLDNICIPRCKGLPWAVDNAPLLPQPARVQRLGRAPAAKLHRLVLPSAWSFSLDQAFEPIHLFRRPSLWRGTVRISVHNPTAALRLAIVASLRLVPGDAGAGSCASQCAFAAGGLLRLARHTLPCHCTRACCDWLASLLDLQQTVSQLARVASANALWTSLR